MKRSIVLGGVAGLWVVSTVAVAPAQISEDDPAQLYELTTQMGMPNLEENLRYTLRHTQECLTGRMLVTVFPILEHPALQGCSLQDELRNGTTLSYRLICAGGHGTKGEATWKFEKPMVRGVLHVTLGGKNMTFYQKVTAIPLGSCTR